MIIKPEELYKSPNILAKYYSHFKVSERLLLTGHSHQAWPDCGFKGQQQAWLDAAENVDDKWGKAFEKANKVKKEFLNLLGDDANITLASNTHDLVIRFLSSLPINKQINIVTTDGEFHTIRRQLDRLAEEGIEIVKVASSPSETVVERLIEKVNNKTIAVLVSKVFFQTGEIVNDLASLQQKCEKTGTRLLVDAYHAMNVVPFSLKEEKLENAFVVGGGYKYCQLGEGNCFLRFPKGSELRPVITGWYSEFGTLAKAKKKGEVLYGTGDDLFAGSTYDPTSNYRAAEVFDFFKGHNLTPEYLREISGHQVSLLANEFDKIDADPKIIYRNKKTAIKNIGGFLVLYSSFAGEISLQLKKEGVWTDYRGNSLRLGPAPYLSDNQLKESITILMHIIKKINFH
jgi:selenocysteine lyase/cysteine desulfurase